MFQEDGRGFIIDMIGPIHGHSKKFRTKLPVREVNTLLLIFTFQHPTFARVLPKQNSVTAKLEHHTLAFVEINCVPDTPFEGAFQNCNENRIHNLRLLWILGETLLHPSSGMNFQRFRLFKRSVSEHCIRNVRVGRQNVFVPYPTPPFIAAG